MCNTSWHPCENTLLPGKKNRKINLLLEEEKEYVLGMDFWLRTEQNALEDLTSKIQGHACLRIRLNQNKRKKSI